MQMLTRQAFTTIAHLVRDQPAATQRVVLWTTTKFTFEVVENLGLELPVELSPTAPTQRRPVSHHLSDDDFVDNDNDSMMEKEAQR
jgi:hypothetical protein